MTRVIYDRPALLVASVGLLFCLFVVSPVRADVFNYGTISGDDVTFTDISEDTSGGDPLFGPPQVIGNTLDFDPVNFVATAGAGQPASIVDSQLSFVVTTTTDPNFIDRVRFLERGDYNLAGVGDATAVAAVQAHVFWDILEVGGVALTTPVSGEAALVFSPSNGTYSLGTDLSADIWIGELELDLDVPATKVFFTLDNTLIATAADGGTSLIKKKDGDIQIEIIIPEPASGGMIFLGMLGMLAAYRRRGR